MKKLFRKNRKGISTVIATIIIVAISIVMAIAVAYWALGIGGSFTRYEKLQFTSAYPTIDGTNYLININLKNTGTILATFSNETIFLNGQPMGGNWAKFDMATLYPGNSTKGNITLPIGSVWTSGMNVEVKIQTASGNQYPQVVVLP